MADSAKLTDEEQTLSFGDLLRTIYALNAEGFAAPQKLVSGRNAS